MAPSVVACRLVRSFTDLPPSRTSPSSVEGASAGVLAFCRSRSAASTLSARALLIGSSSRATCVAPNSVVFISRTSRLRPASEWQMPCFCPLNARTCAHGGHPSVVPNFSIICKVILNRLGIGIASSGLAGSLGTDGPSSIEAGEDCALKLRGGGPQCS